jgi:hypothetical protein
MATFREKRSEKNDELKVPKIDPKGIAAVM